MVLIWKSLRSVGLPIIGGTTVCYTVLDLSGYSFAQVVGRSMQPTFNPHLSNFDRTELKKSNKERSWTYFFSNPLRFIEEQFQPLDWVLISSKNRFDVKPGEIVTLHNAFKPNDCDVKRVTAIGNQLTKSKTYKNRVVIVPKGYIWIEGDHPILSKDSNTYGPIPASLVYGKTVAIIWPPSRWQLLDTHKPNTSTNHIGLNASEIPPYELSQNDDKDDE